MLPTGWSQPGVKVARCGWRPRQRGSFAWASSPHARQRTCTSEAWPLTPVSRSASRGSAQGAKRCVNSTQGKSSRWPAGQASRKRAASTGGALRAPLQLACSYRVRSVRTGCTFSSNSPLETGARIEQRGQRNQRGNTETGTPTRAHSSNGLSFSGSQGAVRRALTWLPRLCRTAASRRSSVTAVV